MKLHAFYGPYIYLLNTWAIFLGIGDTCKFVIVVNKDGIIVIATSADFFSLLQNFTKISEEFRCSVDSQTRDCPA
jgi:hypothetical protein